MHCKYLSVVPYKVLEKFSKALYGTTGSTYSERVFRPVMIKLELSVVILDVSFKLPLGIIEPVIFIKPTLTYFLGTIRNIIVTAIFLALLSCGTAYLIYSSLARISCGSESIFTITLEVCYKLTVRHDLSIILHTFFFFLNLLYNYLILLCKVLFFFLCLVDTLQLGLRPVRLSGHVIVLL